MFYKKKFKYIWYFAVYLWILYVQYISLNCDVSVFPKMFQFKKIFFLYLNKINSKLTMCKIEG